MTLVGGRVVRRQLTLLVAALAARSPVKVESAVVLIKSQWPDAKKNSFGIWFLKGWNEAE